MEIKIKGEIAKVGMSIYLPTFITNDLYFMICIYDTSYLLI